MFDKGKVRCPRCRQFAISLWMKMVTAPAGTIKCPNCGGNAIVPVSGLWTGIPALSAIVIALWYVDSLAADIAIVAFGTALSAWLNYKYVQLAAV